MTRIFPLILAVLGVVTGCTPTEEISVTPVPESEPFESGLLGPLSISVYKK